MISESLVAAASENLIETYVKLGMEIPGTVKWINDSFVGCEGVFPHSVCNFAARLRLDPWSARRLRKFADACPSFNIYVTPNDRPDHLSELLVRAGFQLGYRLVQMVAEDPAPQPAGGKAAPLVPVSATTHAARVRVADFMTRQFFQRQSDSFRQKITLATAKATHLDLLYAEERGQKIGGVMLCNAAEIIGVYNLCVASPLRGRGIGRNVLNWALTIARESNRAVTVQCDPRLEHWYSYQGFVSTGKVEVYSLPKPLVDPIIL